MKNNIGIAAIGLSIPPLAMKLDELAKLHGVDAEKYTIGLGCQEMALCPDNMNVVDLAEIASKRALANWHGNLNDIGMLVVGTETGLDMSRPLSSWVMERLNLKGPIRSYEVKHACFAGTLAVRQALEWRLSENSKGKAALVIAADQGLYAYAHPGEPTQGSGAIAMIIDQGEIAVIEPISYAWSSPEYDFWRPVGEPFPSVNGRLSMECYKLAVIECFKQLLQGKNDLIELLNNYAYCCFHVPFPKMVMKAFTHLGTSYGLAAEQIATLYQQKVVPTLAWNIQIGNCYTASLWFTVANALANMQQHQQVLAFSYGSGFGAELLTMVANHNKPKPYWQEYLQADFANRKFISYEDYLLLRKVNKVANFTKTKESII